MKISGYTIISLVLILVFTGPGCTKLEVPPMNIVQDKDLFGSENGIRSYMARMYAQLPIEDFRYTPRRGFNDFWIIDPFPTITGEALSNNQTSAETEAVFYWGNAYRLIRDVNYFVKTLPGYKTSSGFSEEQVNTWLGEAYFIRAVTYFELVKRYGGVPIIEDVLSYPEQSVEELRIPRSSEEATYNKIAEDLDKAYSMLPEKNQTGRANKYAAAGFKSRAMLFAGSIAKYNEVTLFDNENRQLCGIPSAKAADYFRKSYDAAKLLEGVYSLYKSGWKADDKEAQYQNYIDLFFAAGSPENIFVRQYGYPESVHGYDVYNIPYQFMVGGYSSAVNPTLDFVEMFDGLPMRNGKLDVYDGAGKYRLYDKQMDLFANAEPRLRATVIFPGDLFKNQVVEIWRGIYTGEVAGGISSLLPAGSRVSYENSSNRNVLVTSAGPDKAQTIRQLPNGTNMTAAGRSGRFYGTPGPALTGFSVRKWLNPSMPANEVVENRSAQTWIEMRYAEVLLNRAEAAYELFLAGASGADYRGDAYECIRQIQERAGANVLPGQAALTSIDIIRKERRKELSFENKIWWDLKRWRIMDDEQNGRTYRALMPFYAEKAGKWFFDDRFEEKNGVFTFDTRWYYQQIDPAEITKSPNLIQNPGY
ncbi:RagB/SusD family nutrient uptake outer membrane protein [Pararcticibacter amylolyticus]|uniref:RagB/SusD family nutrient uptake outer membrane protein n=1 Tax=Pararcticibacter amylolyticus TaxID=2173175 RepID=A0A2U2PA54_9SPHI|nr:RagB/SusD family nutrient uptake outer membrane protein [Pararcticibacter amylolyticus]PWG78250.1 RagB/SusD family nutrient uptake outer membrane protein [Pararcticibacter amylolyticus]